MRLPIGIIDIGSNSVRFVAYAGSPRVPSTLFNEKVTAQLGRGLAIDNRIDEEAAAKALASLARFRQLARDMGLKEVHTVATAAVRDAANGATFLKKVASLGLKPKLLSGEEEAELAGLGVISAIPRASGVVADLGGGSLELVGVARGNAGEGRSLPLGVLRTAGMDQPALAKAVDAGIKGTRLGSAARGHSLYLVGGAFRALAMLDLMLADHPLPIVHLRKLRPERLVELRAWLASNDEAAAKEMTGLSSSRIRSLLPALDIVETLIAELSPRRVVVSAYGLREGLLFRELEPRVRAQDPLIAAALEVGEKLGRFGDHGAEIDAWIAPLFPDDDGDAQRLRLVACLLADIAWNAHPDYRSERAADLALHGNWVGTDTKGRVMLARTLGAVFGDADVLPGDVAALLDEASDTRARAWGQAIRLAQRLSAGTLKTLGRTAITRERQGIRLYLQPRYKCLWSNAVERRLVALGRAMNCDAALAD